MKYKVSRELCTGLYDVRLEQDSTLRHIRGCTAVIGLAAMLAFSTRATASQSARTILGHAKRHAMYLQGSHPYCAHD